MHSLGSRGARSPQTARWPHRHHLGQVEAQQIAAVTGNHEAHLASWREEEVRALVVGSRPVEMDDGGDTCRDVVEGCVQANEW